MTRFAVASDLHLGFHADGGRTIMSELPDTELIVIAGDLCSAREIWPSLLMMLTKYQHVIFVLGNHEFYGSSFHVVRRSINKLRQRLPKLRKRGATLGELHLLDNSTVEIGGQRFVGTSLWFRHEPAIELKHHFLNDFQSIEGAGRRIYVENQLSLDFLEATVKPTDVVVTHHLPHAGSIHPKWEGSKYNCFFLCEMEPFICQRKPKLWIHGHTHHSFDYNVHDTRIVCNPFGYVAYGENPDFDSNLTIEYE